MNHPALWRLLGLTLAGTLLVTACGGSEGEGTPSGMTLEKIGSFDGGVPGAAEITAFDAASKRLFVVNGANGTVDVLDLSSPAVPVRVGVINVAAFGTGVNSVAVSDGLVASTTPQTCAC